MSPALSFLVLSAFPLDDVPRWLIVKPSDVMTGSLWSQPKAKQNGTSSFPRDRSNPSIFPTHLLPRLTLGSKSQLYLLIPKHTQYFPISLAFTYEVFSVWNWFYLPLPLSSSGSAFPPSQLKGSLIPEPLHKQLPPRSSPSAAPNNLFPHSLAECYLYLYHSRHIFALDIYLHSCVFHWIGNALTVAPMWFQIFSYTERISDYC